jgi:hypothetical protein
MRGKTPTSPGLLELRKSIAVRIGVVADISRGRRSTPSEIARDLGVDAQTWRRFGEGSIIPAASLLRFMAATGASHAFLLHGTGPPRRASNGEPVALDQAQAVG